MRYNFHSSGQQAVVQLTDFFMQRGQSSLRLGPFSEQDNALPDVVIVDGGAVYVADCLPQLPEPHFRCLYNSSEVANSNWRPIDGFNDGGGNVIRGLHQADG